ncbi:MULTISPECIES: TonB-dependent siderophore receptor [unclassified Pseudomonas]|uniref:TonB-dependent receptor n=1 Tax=unclassified Pseudomonas TaxID=196821 RepID=UPI000BCA5C5A|nr:MULTISPECIES: TonB-dependent siderophore receptor [unclassified Pseudomonas]PVZ20619.1 iron complex outermembrane receptor protein [Pseudomonas sp. URIL14HWK12:I12]PVZ27685.1 iron complex outermembrane receptor protein [Pseudomonas sp. URIL14HWK12:I10]PVZ38574.1 iron complex outermembrane receptor protein [Pseudomonas sp. URIL14HWK12:I11]SNZ02816.1 iron complex outermembrane recepter protein [Pseudomonas sp. URIL14HWK12:I9]
MARAFPSRPTALALCCSFSLMAHAAEPVIELGATDISGTALRPAANPMPETYGGGQVARGGQMGVLGNQDVHDVPFTLNSYTAKLIEDQQAEDVGDVLANDPSVRQAFGYGNQSQLFVIRGLPLAGDDIAYNGLYGVLPRQILSTDAIERVEVFKGPSAFLNGASPTGTGLGGNVNLQPKRAGDTPTRRYTQDISTDGRIGEHLDLGQRFGEDNRFGARLNLSQREGETAIDDQDQRTKLFVAGLDYRGDGVRLSTDFGYQKQRINHLRNSVRLGTATGIPTAPDADHNYGQPWTYAETEDTFGMLRGEWDLSENWTAYVAGGAKHTRETGFYGTPVLVGNSGAATITGSEIPHNEDNTSFAAGLNGRLQTGPVSHQIALGATALWAQQENAYTFYRSTAGNTNLYGTPVLAKPTEVSSQGGDMGDPGVTGKTLNRGLALSDTLGLFDDRLLLTYGLRRQQLRVQSYSYDGPVTDGSRTALYDKAITTPVYGIVYKATDTLSLYANRIEGLAKGSTASGAGITNPGETFPPGRTKQMEAGIKLDMGNYGADLSAFRIERPTDGYLEGNTFVQNGMQVNKGIELSLFGEPIEGLRVIAGGTRMTSEVEDTQGGRYDGNEAIGVPTFQLNASVDWDVPGLPGVALSARALRTGTQYADQANTLKLPAWNRFDAGARYRFKVSHKDVTLRMNVENLTNKNYWASANGGYLTQGEPRLVKFSGTVDF